MADSDSDDENTVKKELEVFQDEIKSILRISLSDKKTAFKSLIAEVEHLRNAYKQDPASLNKAVLKALFDLPFGTTTNPLPPDAYFKLMNELLEQYSPLIKSLKRDKKTQEEGGIAVADPLIQLLKSGKLSPDVWSQGNAKKGLAALLIQHSIIAESQITTAVNAIDKACFAEVQPETDEDVAGPSTAAMGAAVGGDTVTKPSGECTSKQRLKRKRHDNLSTGQFSGKFTHTGGKLDCWMSDDYLEIPEGAIPEGEEWTIHGNIHTSLDSFAHLLKKTKGECFVAAINDYRVVGGHTFNKPVKVVVHHSVHKTSELANLCIQLRSDKHESIDVPYHTQKTADGPWYEVDGPRILVYTYHFTQVICKIGDSEECNVKAIKALVYGKITPDVPNKFCAAIEVYIHFIRNVQKLPVFNEVFSREKNETGFKLIQAKTFPSSLRSIAATDQVSVTIRCTDKEWNFLDDSDFKDKKIDASVAFPCLTDADDPECLGTYMLQGSARNLNGNITLSIGGSHVVKLPIAMTLAKQLDVAKTVDDSQFATSFVQWIMNDANLYTLGKNIKCKTWFEVGLELGLTSIELDQIDDNNSNQIVERRIFNMLRLWRDKQETIGEQELETLRRSLHETVNKEAMKLLKPFLKEKETETAQEPTAEGSVLDSAQSE